MKLKTREKNILQVVNRYIVDGLSWQEYYKELGRLLK